MELRLPSTKEIFTTFQDLYIIVNILISKEDYTITTKRFKKNEKRELQKV